MTSLGDVKLSLRMREVIASIASSVIDTMRPEERIGKVFSYNGSKQTAQILFAGESIDSLVTVHVAGNMIPSKVMATKWALSGYGAPADIVRVAGKPGNYYITDFINGSPDFFYGKDVGFISMWAGLVVPSSNYMFCRGGSFSGSAYPQAAGILGDTYGTHSGDTYYLPNFNARSPVGVGGVAASGSAGNNYSVGQGWGHEAMPTHTHVQNAHAHGTGDPGHFHYFYNVDQYVVPAGGPGAVGSTGNFSGANSATSQQFTGVTVSANTATNQNSGTGDKGNVHPVLGINYIIKVR